jgi:hypothetical protein
MLDVLVPQRNLKVLASAVSCLGKIGKDLCIEADQDQLILRALNDSNSVFAAFYFKRVRTESCALHQALWKQWSVVSSMPRLGCSHSSDLIGESTGWKAGRHHAMCKSSSCVPTRPTTLSRAGGACA